MKNLEMDTSAINHPRPSLSPGVLEQPFKRRKLDTSITSTSPIPFALDPQQECKRLKKELLSFKARLSESEVTVTKLHRIRKELEEIFENERRMLQSQLKVDTEMIEQLKVELDEVSRASHKALEAKDSEMSQMISELRAENASLRENIIPSDPEASPASPESQEDPESQAKLQIAEKKIVELEEKLEDNMIAQTEFDLLSVELQQLNNQKLKIEKTASDQKKILVARLQELEEELKASKNTISTLQDAVKEMELLKQKDLEKTEMIVMLEQKNAELFSMISGYEAGGIVAAGVTVPSPDQEESSAVDSIEEQAIGSTVNDLKRKIDELESDEEVEDIPEDRKDDGSDIELLEEKSPFSIDDKESSSCDQPLEIDTDVEIVELESVERSLEIGVGEHSILVSSQEFFEIDWMNEYRHDGYQRYFCKNCQSIQSNSMDMEDHVWIAHYNGFFECPTCSGDGKPFSLARRESIGQHMMEAHPYLFI